MAFGRESVGASRDQQPRGQLPPAVALQTRHAARSPSVAPGV